MRISNGLTPRPPAERRERHMQRRGRLSRRDSGRHKCRKVSGLCHDPVFGQDEEHLVVVKPATVIRWHRNGFRYYWKWKSRSKPGRPPIGMEVILLIDHLSGWVQLENLHRAPRGVNPASGFASGPPNPPSRKRC